MSQINGAGMSDKFMHINGVSIQTSLNVLVHQKFERKTNNARD